MPVYAWSGISAAGKEVKGTRDAESPKALRATLRREGVLVEAVAEARAKAKASRDIDLAKYFRRVSTLELAVLTRQLATLLKSGVPLVESLTALIEQLEQPELHVALTDIRDRVNEGTSLADALRQHSKIFQPLFINMVAAGEASGTLEAVLGRLADFLEASARLRGTVTKALAYPAFMAVLGVGVIILLMTTVVPQVSTIFDSFQATLPWYTRLLRASSEFMASFWWLFLAGIVGGTYGFRRWVATPEGRATWHRTVLKMPFIGKLVTMIAVARFARTLATLLRAGVQLLTAMEITRNVLGNAELERVIEEARTSIREGESIAGPLKRSKKFPAIMTHMIAVGERSGQLEEMLENVATNYDAQVEARIGTVTALIEPIMIVVLGVGAGGIVLSIIMPLMQVSGMVQ